jgi:hypothetical protein
METYLNLTQDSKGSNPFPPCQLRPYRPARYIFTTKIISQKGSGKAPFILFMH